MEVTLLTQQLLPALLHVLCCRTPVDWEVIASQSDMMHGEVILGL
jgi:hypothetical protein